MFRTDSANGGYTTFTLRVIFRTALKAKLMTDQKPDDQLMPLFRTEHAVRAIARIISQRDNHSGHQYPEQSSIYDPCCGSGSFLLAASQLLQNATVPAADYLLCNPPFGKSDVKRFSIW